LEAHTPPRLGASTLRRSQITKETGWGHHENELTRAFGGNAGDRGRQRPVLGGGCVNGSTVKSVLKKDGKVVGSTTRTISAHGKVMTLSTKATDVKGVAHDEVAVYDKQ
jgi:hypothetical protein